MRQSAKWLGAVHLSYLNRITWLPTVCCRTIEGAPVLVKKAQGVPDKLCCISSFQIIVFLFPQQKEDKMTWHKSPLLISILYWHSFNWSCCLVKHSRICTNIVSLIVWSFISSTVQGQHMGPQHEIPVGGLMYMYCLLPRGHYKMQSAAPPDSSKLFWSNMDSSLASFTVPCW